MIKNIDLFEKMSVPKAVAKLATPTVLSMIVTVFYNMVDTIFVGQLGDKNQVAAVSVATPVFLFFMAVGNIFGVGGSSFLSRALGEHKVEKAARISSFCLYGGIIAGLIGESLMLFFMDDILSLVGTDSDTFIFAKEYLTVIAYGGPLIVVSTAFTNLVRGEGASKNAMVGMMAGTVVNIILDPFFILPSFLGMGTAGAAVATVIGNGVSIVFFFAHAVGKKSVLSLNIKNFRISKEILFGVLVVGLPASLNNIIMSLSNIIVNRHLVAYGSTPVAAMGIAMKANMLVIFVQMGLAIGVSPLIGYNFGAKNFKRMKDVMKFSTACVVVLGCMLTAIYFVLSKSIINVFMDKNTPNIEVVTFYGVKMLRALMISGPYIGIMFIFSFTFQAIGKALPSLILSISRQGFVFLPVIIIFDKLFQLDGIIYAQPIADAIAVFIAIGMFLIINKNLKKSV
ncbi:MAG: MATE family efflux transporter [Spirochaetales bacterium]|nr:MATE family efflux transporter [Spirochaetales bacterium]